MFRFRRRVCLFGYGFSPPVFLTERDTGRDKPGGLQAKCKKRDFVLRVLVMAWAVWYNEYENMSKIVPAAPELRGRNGTNKERRGTGGGGTRRRTHMNLLIARRAADYLYKCCIKSAPNPKQIPYYPQKTEVFPLSDAGHMPRRVAPESEGVSSAYIERFLHELEADRHTNAHNLLILRRGKLIAQASAPGYSPLIWSLTHSMAKTITSFAIAILIGDGALSLDTNLFEIFGEGLPPISAGRVKRVTIRHLLTMTSGLNAVDETATVTIDNWKRAYLTSIPTSAPGKQFRYNSVNSYMLAAVVEKVTGESLNDFLTRRLFRPLGIRHLLMEKSPEGITKGGWGMYVTPCDMAKLGQLVLQMGEWHGKQLLPREYLEEAIRPQTHLNDSYGDYDYGYHLWVARDGSSILFNGMLGQNIWINPHTEMVVVFTAGNEEFFQVSTGLRTVARYFGGTYCPEDLMIGNPVAFSRLKRAERLFFAARNRVGETLRVHDDPLTERRQEAVPDRMAELIGAYVPEENNIGLLPLCVRLMQNSHAGGITRIGFERQGEDFLFCVTEGETRHVLPCGFSGYRYTTLDFLGEPYLVGTCVKFVENEDGEELVKVDVVFPEIPNSRHIKLYFRDENHLALAFREKPGAGTVAAVLQSCSANVPEFSRLIGFAMDKLNEETYRRQIMHCMEPVIYAERTEEKPPLKPEEEMPVVRAAAPSSTGRRRGAGKTEEER